MRTTGEHLRKAVELLTEEAKLARYEWEERLEQSKEAQREEAKAREKYTALTATVHLLKKETIQEDSASHPNIDDN